MPAEAASTEPASDSRSTLGGQLVAGLKNAGSRGTAPLLVAIVGLAAFTTTKSDVFLTQGNLENLLQQSAVLGLLGVGMTLLMVAGQLDLSVGALAALISVVGAKLAAGGSASATIVLVSLGLGVAGGAVTGFVVAFVRVSPFILTLGSASVFLAIALIVSGGEPVAVDGGTFSTFAFGKWLGVPAAGLLFIAMLVVGSLFLRYTRLGRNAFAMGSSPQAAFLSGIDVSRVTIALFSLNGLLVGVAAIVLLGRLGAGDPNAGVGLELQAIAAVVLGGASLTGGRGTMWGTFLGVLLLGMIANSLTLLGTGAAYQEAIYGGVLIVAVVATALREQGRLGLSFIARAIRRRPDNQFTVNRRKRS